MTWLKFINKYILQFFCIRLGRIVENDRPTNKYVILKWIKPFTGWTNDYVYLNKNR